MESNYGRGCRSVGRWHFLGLIMSKAGLYANILAKQERIKAGSGEKMNKVGSKDAPTAKDFKDAAKTAKPENK